MSLRRKEAQKVSCWITYGGNTTFIEQERILTQRGARNEKSKNAVTGCVVMICGKLPFDVLYLGLILIGVHYIIAFKIMND